MEAIFCFLAPTAAVGETVRRLKAAAFIRTGSMLADSGFGGTLYSVLYFIFMSAVILAVAYYATRFLAKKGTGFNKNKNLKLVESLPLGMDKSLVLVKVGEQYLLLSSCQKNLSLVTSIEPDKLYISDTSELSNEIKEESLESYMDELSAGGGIAERSNTVKNSLNRLKSMVRGSKTDG